MVLLIGGHARSGTTMLWKLCNGHPDIRLTYEFREFYALGKPFREYEHEMLEHMRYRGIYENRVLGLPDTSNKLLRGMNILSGYGFAARYLFGLRRYRMAPIDSAAVEATLKGLFPHARVVGDKYPNYVFMLDKLTGIGDRWVIMLDYLSRLPRCDQFNSEESSNRLAQQAVGNRNKYG